MVLLLLSRVDMVEEVMVKLVSRKKERIVPSSTSKSPRWSLLVTAEGLVLAFPKDPEGQSLKRMISQRKYYVSRSDSISRAHSSPRHFHSSLSLPSLSAPPAQGGGYPPQGGGYPPQGGRPQTYSQVRSDQSESSYVTSLESSSSDD